MATTESDGQEKHEFVRWDLKDRHYMGKSRRTGDRQSRMVSTCGPTHPSGCRWN